MVTDSRTEGPFPTTHGQARCVDGSITIHFGYLVGAHDLVEIELDVTAYAAVLLRDLAIAVVEAMPEE